MTTTNTELVERRLRDWRPSAIRYVPDEWRKVTENAVAAFRAALNAGVEEG